MAQAVGSSRGLIRAGALAAITPGVLHVVGVLLPVDQGSTGLAVLYLVTDVGIAFGLIAWITISRGSLPTGILASTLPPRGSITDTSLDCSFVTCANWLSDVAAIQCGITPNFISFVFL